MTADIYGLYCPDSGMIRYIGKANCAETRFKGHLRDSARRKTPVYLWIASLLAQSKTPVLTILKVVEDCDWQEEERAAIREAKAQGSQLLNLAKGGNEPFCSPEVRAANGKRASIARASTPEKKRLYYLVTALGRLLKAGNVREDTKEKLRLLAARFPGKFPQWASI